MPDPLPPDSAESLFQKILRKIPGFGGYLEASDRRESELKTRQWMANHLESGKQAVDGYARQLANSGQIDSLPVCDGLRRRLDLLISQLTSTPAHGISFFSKSSLDEEQLEDLYEYDLWLMDEAEQLAQRMQSMASSAVTDVLGQFEEQVMAIETKWKERQQQLE